MLQPKRQNPQRCWNPDAYRLVESLEDAAFQEYQKTEVELIRQIPALRSRVVVDLGCGYGRIFKHIAPFAKEVVGIDSDKNMLRVAEAEAKKYGNVTVARADVTRGFPPELSSLFGYRPALVCLQNTLGTLEGSVNSAIENIRETMQDTQGDVVLSLFCQEALSTWGVEIYRKLVKLVGEISVERCDFGRGLFVSKTGYTSHWWKPEERLALKESLLQKGGRVVKEVDTGKYYILHVSNSGR